MIISAFPGCGKTTLVARYPEDFLDSDSSQFDKSLFPGNYIAHIKEHHEAGKIVLVSTHEVVRKALTEANLPYMLVFPDKSLKEEYKQRYLNRVGFNGGLVFAKLIESNWDTWIDQCMDHPRDRRIILQSGRFLSDHVISLPELKDSGRITNGELIPLSELGRYLFTGLDIPND